VHTGETHKRRHSLYQACNGPDLLARLESLGIDLAAEVGRYVAGECPFAILAAGSIAEGTANAASDLDLLVLVPSQRQLKRAQAAVHLESGHSAEVLLYREGVELNIDFMARDRLDGVVEAFLAIAPVLYDAREVKRIPLIQPTDLQFLHRLRSGWVLKGEDIVQLWRDEFIVELLPLYLTVRYFYLGIEMLEDAVAVEAGPTGAVPYMARQAVESGLLSILATTGCCSQSHKWLLHWSERALTTLDPTARSVLHTGRQLLFPGELELPAERQDYLDAVRRFYGHVCAVIERDIAVRKAIQYITAKIGYVGLDAPACGGAAPAALEER